MDKAHAEVTAQTIFLDFPSRYKQTALIELRLLLLDEKLINARCQWLQAMYNKKPNARRYAIYAILCFAIAAVFFYVTAEIVSSVLPLLVMYMALGAGVCFGILSFILWLRKPKLKLISSDKVIDMLNSGRELSEEEAEKIHLVTCNPKALREVHNLLIEPRDYYG